MAKYEKGSFIVTPNAQQLKGLPTMTQMVFVWISYHANQDGVCFPSMNLLAEEAGMSRASVVRHIKSLVDIGFLEKTSRKKKGSKENDSNIYTVIIGVGNARDSIGSIREIPRGIREKQPLVSQRNSNSIHITQSNKRNSDSKESQQPIIDKKESKHSIPDKKTLNNKWKAVRPELIKLFEAVDSVNTKNWYANVTQLKALDELLDSEGEATIRRAIELLPEVLKEEFCPRVYTPHELLKKWPKLKQYLISRKTRKEPQKNRTIASMAEDMID